ncbi:unnamed protein product [Prorocentrum cordatum]|uniref:Uncharacterized protein n=1 Tax=Prorocentrum cordatum TaxID=2364126 RepID=A0ABN9V9S4_9DINO|nr:unnamed protein product [Polarella glacialis]
MGDIRPTLCRHCFDTCSGARNHFWDVVLKHDGSSVNLHVEPDLRMQPGLSKGARRRARRGALMVLVRSLIFAHLAVAGSLPAGCSCTVARNVFFEGGLVFMRRMFIVRSLIFEWSLTHRRR